MTTIGDNAFSGCDNLVSAIFEDTTGWYVEQYGRKSHIDITNPVTAAEYLTDVYASSSYEWHKE